MAKPTLGSRLQPELAKHAERGPTRQYMNIPKQLSVAITIAETPTVRRQFGATPRTQPRDSITATPLSPAALMAVAANTAWKART